MESSTECTNCGDDWDSNHCEECEYRYGGTAACEDGYCPDCWPEENS